MLPAVREDAAEKEQRFDQRETSHPPCARMDDNLISAGVAAWLWAGNLIKQRAQVILEALSLAGDLICIGLTVCIFFSIENFPYLQVIVWMSM